MPQPPKPAEKEQKLLQNARREGVVILVAWALALAWSNGVGYFLGYDQERTIRTIAGIPDWVFWSVFVPWGLCLAFSAWFCFGFVADDDLGEDRAGDSVND